MQNTMKVVILTGAGVSAESGIPTFRDSNGLWENHKIEDVATPNGWLCDPTTVWRFYQQRRRDMEGIEPNAAHYALVELEKALTDAGHEFLLITQNIDGLHLTAGSKNVCEMHGVIRRIRCQKCKHTIEGMEYLDDELLPCPECGWFAMRPDIVWFEEMPREPERFESAVRDCTHFATVGTSGQVYPAAGFLYTCMKRAEVKIYHANTDEAPAGGYDGIIQSFIGPASEQVPIMCETILEDK